MAMRIANNIPAMTTHRWLGIADAGLTKSLERLSSGYRINRAADDAAGLAISQTFRANIASFKVASRNASEASALLQVAEGGMDQIGNMLTRLKELATQASSANAGTSEREKIDAEADQLIIEIDRIAASTKYGSTALLDGNFGVSQETTKDSGVDETTERANDMIGTTNVIYDLVFTVGSVMSGASVTALGSSVTEGVAYYMATTAADKSTVHLTNSAGTVAERAVMSAGATTIEFTNLGITIALTAALSDTAMLWVATAAGGVWTDLGGTKVTFTRTGLTSLTANNAATGTYTISDAGDGSGTITIYGPTQTEAQVWAAQSQTITFDNLNISFNLSGDWTTTSGDLEGLEFTVATNEDATGSTFQIGAENNANNQIAIAIDGVETTTLGINTIDLSETTGAQEALGLIDSAISTLAGSRGDIGAYMNRLAYASANLATTIENTQAAESVIRDVDMASEMTQFTKNQILLQAGTAMLAQANMAPQQVLALFG